MAENKFHINPETGVINRCRANVKDCLFGPENHFDHAKDGRKRYEELNAEKTFVSVSKNKTKKNEPAEKNNEVTASEPSNTASETASKTSTTKPKPKTAKVGMRELNNMAKEGTPEQLMQAADHGSERVLQSLTRNPNATADSLARVAERSEDRSTVRAAMEHKNYPVSKLSGEDFVNTATYKNAVQRLSSPDLTDEHVQAVMKNREGKNSYGALEGYQSNILANHDAKISRNVMNSVAETSPSSMKTAVRENSYDLTANQNRLTADHVSHISSLTQLSSEQTNVLARRASTLLSKHDNELSQREKVALQSALNNISQNPNAGAEALDITVNSMQDIDRLGTAERIYTHPNVSENTKRKILAKSPDTVSRVKISKIESQQNVDLAKTLVSNVNRHQGRGSFSTTTATIDVNKAKSYGLSKHDVMVLMDAKSYNGVVKLDESTGEFVAERDSSD